MESLSQIENIIVLNPVQEEQSKEQSKEQSNEQVNEQKSIDISYIEEDEKILQSYIDKSVLQTMNYTFNGKLNIYKVQIVEFDKPNLKNELGNRLAKLTDCDFAIICQKITNFKLYLSCYSISVDVGEICRQLHGDGDKFTASFTIYRNISIDDIFVEDGDMSIDISTICNPNLEEQPIEQKSNNDSDILKKRISQIQNYFKDIIDIRTSIMDYLVDFWIPRLNIIIHTNTDNQKSINELLDIHPTWITYVDIDELDVIVNKLIKIILHVQKENNFKLYNISPK